MTSHAHRLVMMLIVLVLPALAAAQQSPQKYYSDEELVEMLEKDGYRAVEISDERTISIKVDGLTYVLYVYDDDDLQLYFGVTGYVLTTEHMNEWNRLNRLSRAYLDDENDPILEADLLANAGYTENQFLEWFRVFNFIAREFHQYLIENDLDQASDEELPGDEVEADAVQT